MIFRCIKAVWCVLLCAPFLVHAADTDIIINEIAAYEPSDYEWIEITNRGAASVDMTGWKFFEANTNHSLSAFRGDLIIEPGEHAVIANRADKVAQKYPSFTGTLLDSSWSSLNENGELIALKNSSGITVEQFTSIAAPDYSLERKDPLSTDYSSANWKEHANGNTIGVINSHASFSTPFPSYQKSPPPWRPQRGDIVINELVSDPADREGEWIELHNPTQQRIDITGWMLIDGSGTIIVLSGVLDIHSADRYMAIPLTGGFLDNAGDSIVLKSKDSIIIDVVTYGSWDDGDLRDNAPRAIDPFALARIGSTIRNRDDFRITKTPTKGGPNKVSDEKDGEYETPRKTIIISELYPNPSSNKDTDEFIELYNPGDTPIKLEGWELVSLSGVTYLFGAGEVLEPNTYRAYSRVHTNIPLRNIEGERIRLYAPSASSPTDEVRYTESAPLARSYARDEGGRFHWTKTVTPSEKNTIVYDNRPPQIIIDGPSQGRVHESLTFDASDTHDPDGDPLTFQWNFGDGLYAAGSLINHTYIDEDAFSILITVSDGKESVSRFHHITIQDDDPPREEVSGSRQAPFPLPRPRTVVKQKKKNRDEVKSIPLSQVRSLHVGSRIITEGVVSLPPGRISANYFYLAGSGIQVWNPKKEFPSLEIGDRIVISGVLKKNGKETAIRILSIDDVHLKNRGEKIAVHDISLSEIGESFEGSLVRVKGIIADMRWPNIYLEEGVSRVRVYIAQKAAIEKVNFSKGNTVAITGIVSETSAGYRILPRDTNDIVIEARSETFREQKSTSESHIITIPPREDPRNNLLRYFFVTLLAALTLGVGLGIQYYLDHKKKK